MKKYYLITVCWYNIIKGKRKQVIASSLAYIETPADYLLLFYRANKIFFEQERMESPSILRSEKITQQTAQDLNIILNIGIYGKE